MNVHASDTWQKMWFIAMLRLTHWSFCLPGESGEGWSCPIIPPAVGQRCLHIDSASANFYKIRERILENTEEKKEFSTKFIYAKNHNNIFDFFRVKQQANHSTANHRDVCLIYGCNDSLQIKQNLSYYVTWFNMFTFYTEEGAGTIHYGLALHSNEKV